MKVFRDQIQLLRIVLLFLSFGFQACTHTRVLSAEERTSLGLNGQIHNAKICPEKFNIRLQRHETVGDCEWVLCEPKGPDLECRAQKEPFK